MNKLVSLLAAAALLISMIPLNVEAAIPKAAESENDAVGLAADAPKPGKAKIAPGGTSAMKPTRPVKASEPEKKHKKLKESKNIKPAKKPARRS